VGLRAVRSIVVASVLAVLAVGAALAGGWLLRQGFSAREEPSALEAFVARRLRRLAIPAGAREMKNPIPLTPEVLREARAHFADHCALCHGNDGSGNTDLGRNLYPPAPDMRQPQTQDLSDGELFFIIHNGIRFTGMPAWGPEDPDEDRDSWKLVHFVRHLPKLSPEEIAEMEAWNPKTRHELEEEEAARSFLEGEDASPPP
jgi:mono/diheme cytochrome c family protein